MGMSSHVIGVRPADEKYLAMLGIYGNCRKMEIPVPKEVDEYFNGYTPEKTGMRMDIPHTKDNSVEMQNRLVVKLKDIPEGVTEIIFINSF